LRITV